MPCHLKSAIALVIVSAGVVYPASEVVVVCVHRLSTVDGMFLQPWDLCARHRYAFCVYTEPLLESIGVVHTDAELRLVVVD